MIPVFVAVEEFLESYESVMLILLFFDLRSGSWLRTAAQTHLIMLIGKQLYW